jgi:hypothetical protein
MKVVEANYPIDRYREVLFEAQRKYTELRPHCDTTDPRLAEVDRALHKLLFFEL